MFYLYGREMAKIIPIITLNFIWLLQGCGYIHSGWKHQGADNRVSTVFRNIVYFRNNSPYCTAKVFAGIVKQPVHAKKLFNPVKTSFALKRGGGEHFIEYNFNLSNYYRTKIEWYNADNEYINTEYIGHATSNDDYKYQISKDLMGEQFIKLSNSSRRECWRRRNGDININIHR